MSEPLPLIVQVVPSKDVLPACPGPPMSTAAQPAGNPEPTLTVAAPVIEPVTVSVAVTVWLPAVFRVTALLNVCAPASLPVKG